MNSPALVFKLAIGAALSSSVALANPALHIGDPMPPVKVDRWIKGHSVPEFKKGQVYVVEFWATWCGPCRQAMPHLSTLAKKYAGKATFIGVDIWEDQHAEAGEDLKAKANRFVKTMGARMDYAVCAEPDNKFMSTNWMDAAGQEGIPATFVIGKDSKLNWIGHPIDLDGVLPKVIAGRFDVAAFAAKMNPQIDKNRSTHAIGRGLSGPVDTAIAAKDYPLAIAECNRIMATCPPLYKFEFAMKKFQVLAEHLPSKAYEEAANVASDPDQTWMAAEVFSMTPGLDSKCYDLAMAFFQKKYKDQPNNAVAYAHYAYTYYQLGDAAKAVECYQRFIDGMKPMKLDPVTMAGFEKEMKKFKDAAAKKAGSKPASD